MKKSLGYIFFACLIGITSCVTTESDPLPERAEYIVYATQGSSPDVKTVIDNETAEINWTSGDAINVFFSTMSSGKFVTSESGEIAQFRGSLDVVTGGSNVEGKVYMWGVYPYNANNTCDGSNVTLTLPSVQTAAENTFATDLFPQIARSESFSMGFYNLCGGFRFTVSSPDIKCVTLSGNNNEVVAGRVKVTMDSDSKPKVAEVISGEKVIKMYAPNGGTFKPGVNYYLTLFPTVFSNGLTITYYKSETYASYVYSKPYTLGRSVFSRFANKDQGLTFVPTPLNDWGEGERVEDEI